MSRFLPSFTLLTGLLVPLSGCSLPDSFGGTDINTENVGWDLSPRDESLPVGMKQGAIIHIRTDDSDGNTSDLCVWINRYNLSSSESVTSGLSSSWRGEFGLSGDSDSQGTALTISAAVAGGDPLELQVNDEVVDLKQGRFLLIKTAPDQPNGIEVLTLDLDTAVSLDVDTMMEGRNGSYFSGSNGTFGAAQLPKVTPLQLWESNPEIRAFFGEQQSEPTTPADNSPTEEASAAAEPAEPNSLPAPQPPEQEDESNEQL